MPYPTWQAGQRITADLLLGGSTFNAEQGSDQTVTNSTTLADSNLVVPAEANARYEYTLQAIYSTNTTGKIKFQWSVPNGSMMVRSGHGLGNGQTGGATVGTLVWSSRGDFSTVFNVGGTTGSPPGDASFLEVGEIVTGSTAGNVTLQFAQAAANATDPAILRSLSRLRWRRIG
ncbi:hypothetical protein [Actinacidiphila glaucinigra]|uniref:hypothetical protein n=1 Tax=Actinacidiphila glaucinigra TaxID=235986 RepID=UPI002E343324|nr:hypothetical protein [Actinacidiphila glaucinigra]